MNTTLILCSDSPLSLIADDFTGALDSGVQFVRAGLTTRFVLQQSHGEVQVRVVTTESRNVDESTAVERNHRAVQLCGSTRLFKKIDSTMRGHVGAEIEAVLTASGLARAVVCPAAPDAGRMVEHGRLLVDGIPLHETAFAHDPHWPAHTCMIDELLHRPSTHIESVTPAAIAAAPTAIVYVDARTNDDLAAIARATQDAGALPCGSLGLARAWAALLCTPHPAPPAAPPNFRLPILVVAGSRHPTTHAQLAQLFDAGVESFGPHDALDRIVSALNRRGAAVLRSPSELVAGGASDALAACAARVLHAVELDALVLTGGDTAAAVCRAVDVDAVDIGGELAVGVPWGTIIGGPAAGATIVTKAGGFGSIHLLREIVARHVRG